MHSISLLFSLVLAAAAARADDEILLQCGGDAYTPCPSGYTCVPQEDGGLCILNNVMNPLATPDETETLPTATKGLRRRRSPQQSPTTVAYQTAPNHTPTDLTTRFPTPTGSSHLSPTPITVKASEPYDCKMARYDRNTKVCINPSKEGQDAQAIFLLESGATLSNCIIGPNQSEGVHCLGNCTLNNVWFEDVCEDAVTFRQKSGVSYVNGGGARYASDKVFQHDGFGTVQIKNFFVDGYGKLYRSCGNCVHNGEAPRHVIMDNIYALNGKTLIGINVNYSGIEKEYDTAEISNSTYQSFGKGPTEICGCYTGISDNNRESPKLHVPYPDLCVVNNVNPIKR